MKAETQPGAIVHLGEVAELIGKTRQGARHIADRDEDFPPPICALSGGKTILFWRKQVVEYADLRKRREAESEPEPAPA